MNISSKVAAIAIALGWAVLAGAQAPPDAPAGTNGICNDGTYSQSAHKQGACRGHQGVKEWYTTASSSSSGAGSGSGPTMPAAPAAAPAPAAPPTPAAPPAAPMPSAKPSAASTSSMSAGTPAAGGGPGLVWLNTSSNVYHCQGDRWYGKTKKGAYMSEADAKAKGARADHNKPCGG